jgi:hypothetical protein
VPMQNDKRCHFTKQRVPPERIPGRGTAPELWELWQVDYYSNKEFQYKNRTVPVCSSNASTHTFKRCVYKLMSIIKELAPLIQLNGAYVFCKMVPKSIDHFGKKFQYKKQTLPMYFAKWFQAYN